MGWGRVGRESTACTYGNRVTAAAAGHDARRISSSNTVKTSHAPHGPYNNPSEGSIRTHLLQHAAQLLLHRCHIALSAACAAVPVVLLDLQGSGTGAAVHGRSSDMTVTRR